MKPPVTLFLIAIGGALGALARYGLGGWIQGNRGGFPYGTLVVNLLGCLAIGILMGLVPANIAKPQHRYLFGLGFLGAFTTFSTFSYETLSLVQEHQPMYALVYVSVSVIGGLLAVTLGYLTTRAIWG